MSWEFDPHISVGPIKFGMKRSEAKNLLSEIGLESSEGSLSPEGMPSDDYEGFSVHYSKYNKCNAVEVESKELSFEGKALSDFSWSEFVQIIQQRDAHAEISAHECCSHKLGIRGDKKEGSNHIGSIFLFEADYFFVYKHVPTPTKASSIYIQAGFVEDVDVATTDFFSIEDAAQTIFKSTQEQGIILWNAIPVPFNYQVDFPVIIRKITPILREMYWAESGDQLFAVKTENVDFGWRIKWENNTVNIHSDWRKVPGDLAKALMSEPIKKLCVTKQDFMNEWKMLFKQFNLAIESTEVTFSEVDSQEVALEATNIENYIEGIGKCYANIPETIYNDTHYRKLTNRRLIIAIFLLILSFLALWFVTKESGEDPFFWIKKHWVWLILTPFIIFGLLLIPSLLLRRK